MKKRRILLSLFALLLAFTIVWAPLTAHSNYYNPHTEETLYQLTLNALHEFFMQNPFLVYENIDFNYPVELLHCCDRCVEDETFIDIAPQLANSSCARCGTREMTWYETWCVFPMGGGLCQLRSLRRITVCDCRIWTEIAGSLPGCGQIHS